MELAERQVQANRFPCDGCGAELTYDPASRGLKCAHCGATRGVPSSSTGPVVEHDLRAGLSSAIPRGLGTAARVSRCQECGASVSFPAGTAATRCTFCGSSQVLDQGASDNAIRPESLLPFAVDKKTANAHFATWIGGLWFRPSRLAKQSQVFEVNGVYVPFWTYDADVSSRWTAERGTYYDDEEQYTTQENGASVTKTRKVQRTEWQDAWGSRRDAFDDLLVCASKGLPADLADHFRTFDTSRLVPYAPGFLAGWRAEEYAIGLEEGWKTAEARIEREQESRCGRDVGGDTQRNLRVTNEILRATFKHVLLPVWIAAYRYNGQVYRFLVNGQTGEVVGKAPWSYWKIALAVVVVTLAIVALAFLLGRGNS